MSDTENKKVDDLTQLLENAKDKKFKSDEQSDSLHVTDDNKNKKRKLILDEEKDEDMDFSEEEAQKLRDETLKKIEEHIENVKKNIDKNNLSEYMLENRIELLEQSKYMLNQYIITVLTQLSSKPHAFEILAKMIETIASVNDSVVNINDDKKKTAKTEGEALKIKETTKNIIADIVEESIKTHMTQEKFKNKEKDSIKVVGGSK
jgi:hypothetical protein